jgi:ketosteroid isomerase-like protein
MSELTADDVQIRTVIDNWAQAVRAQDMDRILANHAANVLLFDVPLPVQSRGIDAYRESWNLFFRSMPMPVVFDLSELSITAGNDVGFAHGLIRGDIEGGNEAYHAIRLTVCLRKSGDQWEVVHEHHSVAAA